MNINASEIITYTLTDDSTTNLFGTIANFFVHTRSCIQTNVWILLAHDKVKAEREREKERVKRKNKYHNMYAISNDMSRTNELRGRRYRRMW